MGQKSHKTPMGLSITPMLIAIFAYVLAALSFYPKILGSELIYSSEYIALI